MSTMGDDEGQEPDTMAAGLALLSEQNEELKTLMAKQNELTQSLVELTVKTNELLKEIKVGLFFTPPTSKGAPTTQPPHEPPAPAPGKRRATLSETAEKLKKEGEGQPPK